MFRAFPVSSIRAPWIVATVVLTVGLPAQAAKARDDGTDLRDVVTTMTGKEIRGRVVSRFDPDEVLIVKGGKRVRVPRREVRNIHTVGDDLREFFAHRAAVGDSEKRAWFLVEWAVSKQLHGMARLQALSVVLKHPKFEPARRFLGHDKRVEKGKDVWRWPLDRRFVSLEALDEHHAKWGKAQQLTGEHFRIKTNAGTARAVDMLLDLERLYLFWEDTFGKPLRMREALRPIEVHVWSSMFRFPKISARQLPFYDVAAVRAATFFRPDGKRPEQLFAVATQALIYATLADTRTQYDRSHLCAWAEVGLGLWVEAAFGGKPGQALPREKVILDPLTASTVFRSRPRLNRVIHLHYELYYELSRSTSLRWGATEALVHYLMSDKPDPQKRQKFMQFLDAAFRKARGDSSTAFDAAFGEKVEAMEPKFLRWLQVHRN